MALRILVTGATGLIGRRLIPTLLKRGDLGGRKKEERVSAEEIDEGVVAAHAVLDRLHPRHLSELVDERVRELLVVFGRVSLGRFEQHQKEVDPAEVVQRGLEGVNLRVALGHEGEDVGVEMKAGRDQNREEDEEGRDEKDESLPARGEVADPQKEASPLGSGNGGHQVIMPRAPAGLRGRSEGCICKRPIIGGTRARSQAAAVHRSRAAIRRISLSLREG